MSDRNNYFTLAAAFLVLAGIGVTVNTALFDSPTASASHYHFWTSGPMVAAYVLAGIAAGLFWCGLRDYRFPRRKNWPFPDLSIRIEHGKFVGFPPGRRDDLWIYLYFKINNRERERNASLEIDYRAKLDHGYENGRKFGELVFFASPFEGVPADFPTTQLAQPLDVLPQRSESGARVFHVDKGWASLMESPVQHCILIEDRISGKAIRLPATTGNFASTDWVEVPKDGDGTFTVYPPAEVQYEQEHPVVLSPNPTKPPEAQA